MDLQEQAMERVRGRAAAEIMTPLTSSNRKRLRTVSCSQ